MKELKSNFLKDNWCNFQWSPWIKQEDISKGIVSLSGIYRVKPKNQDYLIYIGQTGNLKRRTSTLKRECNKDKMPFRDPHTGAPCLWAWKQTHKFEYEYSFTLTKDNELERKIIEHFFFWQYRLEYGESPLCSFGRFHKNYTISSNSKKQKRGYHLQDEQINPAGTNSHTPLFLKSSFDDKDWMGLKWSSIKKLNTLEVKSLPNSPGVYKIFTNNELLYIGETKNFKNRFLNHVKKNWSFSEVYFSISIQENNIQPHQLKELENDLIAGYFKQSDKAPVHQFRNLSVH
jgi:predicted GIY-YIG superfamily endonuclease